MKRVMLIAGSSMVLTLLVLLAAFLANVKVGLGVFYLLLTVLATVWYLRHAIGRMAYVAILALFVTSEIVLLTRF
jgi:hypothetical protein